MKGEKPACTLLVAMLTLGIVMVNVGADPQLPKLFLDPPTYTGSLLGEVFTIDINITYIQDLWGFEFKLGYNTTLLDALDAAKGPFPPPPASFGAKIYETEGYLLTYADWWDGESVNGSGTLVTITFNVTYAGTASCTLALYDTKLFDYYGDEILHDVEDGNYNFVILETTVATDKPLYYQGETVEIYGNLTLDGQPYQGLVALEVDDPGGYGIVRRTLQIGSTPPPGDITIIDVVPCSMWGEPKENFSRGTLAYFNVTLRNSGSEWKDVAVAVNAYDGNMVPLGAPTALAPIGPGIHPGFLIACIDIPSWAYIGTGTVYASVFTDLPRAGGVPLCPEKSATFTITGSSPKSTASETQISGNGSTIGNYSLTFKLRIHDVTTGNYTVYASSGILKQKTTSSVTFESYLLGDVDGDGDVDVGDQRKIQLAMFTVPGDPDWNPNADIDGDGDVDVSDQRIQQLHIFEG